MTAYFLYGDGTLVRSGKPLLKAAEAVALTDAIAVLAAARGKAEDRGYLAERKGFAAGKAAGQVEFSKAIAALVAAEAEYRKTQEAEVARLALAALRHIAGSIADEQMTAALARRAIQSLTGRGAIEITVAPEMVSQVEEDLGALQAVVTGDSRLKPTQCRITAPDGQVVADLDTQLAAIEQRWSDIHGD